MFLHLGGGVSVRTPEIIAILDTTLFARSGERTSTGARPLVASDEDTKMRLAEMKDANEAFLARERQAGRFFSCLTEGQEVKSLILTKEKTYLSAIAALTLTRRLEQIDDILKNEGLKPAEERV